MDYAPFTEELKCLFFELLPNYIGEAGQEIGTKIKPDNTPVTSLDHYALKLIRDLISKRFPKDYTIGEEDQKNVDELRKILARRDQSQWTIDGLDGTGNLRTGLNSYGGAVCRRRANKVLYTACFRPIDAQLRGNGFFWAQKSGGSWEWFETDQAYHRLSVAKPGRLERMVIMLEGSSKKFFMPPITHLGKAETTRCSFSSVVAGTAVARGNASALVTVGNKPWDNWPNILLIEEAGGVVTDYQANSYLLENCGDIIAAASTSVHERIVSLLNPEKEENRN